MGTHTSITEAVSEPRRRVVCRVVADTDDAVTLEEVATYATTTEKIGERGSVADAGRHERLRTELHHVHLPKLDDAGVVRYDAEECVVRQGPNLSTTAGLLRSPAEHAEDAVSRQ